MQRSIFLVMMCIGCVTILVGCASGRSFPLFSREPAERSMVAVMIENQETARKHHKGIGQAQMVIEMLVEGGISRFAVLFDRDTLPPVMGPLRSLRPYFIDAVLPYARTIIHAGESPEALEKARSISSLTTINALRYGSRDIFFRDADIPAPHDLFAKVAGLSLLLPQDQVVPWPPYETGNWSRSTGTGAKLVKVNFLSRSHNIEWMYDDWKKTYTRMNGGLESELHPRNVVILEAPITEIGEYGRLTIPLKGKGKVYIFRDGRTMEGTWKKTSDDEPFQWNTQDGSTILLSEGTTWITILSTLDRVTWSP